MTATMRAYQLVAWQQPARFVEVPVPAPGPGEIRVKVAGVGLCHSDLLFLDAEPGRFPYPLPYTLGHEISGWVDALGPGVAGLSEGDAVVVSSHLVCGICRHCITGHDNYCAAFATGLGFGRDGGLAEYVCVPRRSAVGPTTLDPRRAGPLADAGYTSYHAVKRVAPRLVPGTTAVVIGVGGLGAYAVQHLRLLTQARIVAVDAAEHRLDIARSLGVDEALLSAGDVESHLRDAVGPGGALGVFDFVGSDATMRLALAVAAVLGAVAFVGAGGGVAPISWDTLPRECEVFIPQGGTLADLREVVTLAEQGRLRGFEELFSFDETPTAYERLRAGDLRGRAIVLPNG